MDAFRHLGACPAGPPPSPWVTYWLLALVLSVSAPVFSADLGSESGNGNQNSEAASTSGVLEVIQVTAKRRAVSTFDSAQPVTVVDASAIRETAPRVTADALRGEAGVFVQQTTPGQGNAIVRGLKGSEVLHLVDGMRLNNALFRNAPNQYLALVDPELLERVEVVRGPASTLYGADAMGGVVQFLTSKPNFDAGLAGAVSVGLGSVDDTVAFTGFAGAGNSRSAWRAQVSTQNVGDRRTGAGVVAPSGYESRAGSLSYRQKLGDNHNLDIDLHYLKQPSTPRVDELVAGFGEPQPASSEFFFEPNGRTFGHVKLSGDLVNPLADRYEVNVAVQRITDDRRQRDFGAPRRTLERNASTLYGVTAQAERSLEELLGTGAALVYGLEFFDDRVSSARWQQDLASGAVSPDTARFPDGSRLHSYAAYAHLDSPLGSRLNVEAGLRYSRFDIDLARADRPLGAELDLDEVTASLAGRLRLSENLNLVANIGQGFRAPNIFDLGTLGARPGNRFNVANPDLGPEQVLSVDLGLKWSSRDWRGELVAFALDYEDQITSVLTGEVTPENRLVVQSDNVNEVKLHGVELAMEFSLTEKLSGSLNLNTVRGTERDDAGLEMPADRIPPLNALASLRWQHSEALRYTLVGRGARRQTRLSARDQRDPRINPSGTPGWAVLDLQVLWQPSDAWWLNLTLHNLADRRYREHGSGLDAPGRGAVLTVRRSF